MEAYEALQQRLDDSCEAVQLATVETLNFFHHHRTPPPSIVNAMVRLSLGKDNEASRRAAYWLEWHAPPHWSGTLKRGDLQRFLTALNDPDGEIHGPADSLLPWVPAAGAAQIPPRSYGCTRQRGSLNSGPQRDLQAVGHVGRLGSTIVR